MFFSVAAIRVAMNILLYLSDAAISIYFFIKYLVLFTSSFMLCLLRVADPGRSYT